MTARPDIETVKLMLVRALALSMFDGEVDLGSGTTIAVSNKGNRPAYLSADKLAAIVDEWFADRYEPPPFAGALAIEWRAKRTA